jgi:GDP-D-mannose dehydratase
MNGHGAAGTALITGVTGGDGYYLSELLLRNGFNVHGFVRPGRQGDGLPPQVQLYSADLTDVEAVAGVVDTVVGVGDWEAHVQTDAAFLRPADRATTVGDATKAGEILDWRPTFDFIHIVEAMVTSDMQQEQQTCP